ncbi:MAG TPA: glycosyltransferase, partial [Syntrophobacteraceae bacterium]|nr:glycosyltransferase [Syntrophobacteraceae bacterium]
MESFVQLSLSILFLIAVILIWFMIGYQLLLTVAGFFHQMRSRKERAEVDAMTFDFPPVSVLIPAHNEEIVMAATLEAMLALDYPRDRLEILVINDGSTDATGEIVADYVRRD